MNLRLRRQLLRISQSGDPPVELPPSRRVSALLRNLHRKEDTSRPTAAAGDDLDAQLAALGLADEQWGRPEWRAPRGRISHGLSVPTNADDDAWRDELDHDRLESLERELLAELSLKYPSLPPYVPAADRPDPHQPQVVYLPAQQHRRVPDLSDLRVTARTPLGQISKLEAPGVVLQVSSRREGRIQSVSITPADGEPFRVCAKRDAAGKLLGLQIEDR